MTVRSNYSTLTLLPVLNSVPTTHVAMAQYINSVLNPSVQITAQNCNTQLGLVVSTAEAESYIGGVLVDGTPITQQLLLDTPATQDLHIRTLSTCTAASGVCQECLATAGLSGDVGSYISIPTTSRDRYTYVLTLVQSYWGSLFTASPIGSLPFRLPVRRQLYYPNLQAGLQQSFITRLGFSTETETALLGIPDLFEQFLAFAVYYCVGS